MPQTVSYTHGQVIISQAEEGDRFYVITKGEVEVIQFTDDGQEILLRVLSPGGHFGEIALLKQIPRTATVRALTACELVIFTRDEFLTLVQENDLLRDALDHEITFLLNSDLKRIQLIEPTIDHGIDTPET